MLLLQIVIVELNVGLSFFIYLFKFTLFVFESIDNMSICYTLCCVELCSLTLNGQIKQYLQRGLELQLEVKEFKYLWVLCSVLSGNGYCLKLWCLLCIVVIY